MSKVYIECCIQELRRLERAVIMDDDDERARLEDEFVSLSTMADVLWDEFEARGMCGEATRAAIIYNILTGNEAERATIIYNILAGNEE